MSAFDASETPKLKEKHRVYWKEAETPLFILLNRLSQTKTVWFDYPHYLKQKRSEEKGEKGELLFVLFVGSFQTI